MLKLFNGGTQFLQKLRRSFDRKKLVLGIESTFDDSGAAVIDENGKVLGESLISQREHHASAGGVRPEIAMKLHAENIPVVVREAMSQAQIDFKDISALATATRPGFPLSLKEGLKFSKDLVKKHGLPFIPVHHMEAHAMTARSIERIDFPFLVLLASGGHCLLCLCQGLGSYKILGQSLDEPPGAVFDKIARTMGKLADPLNAGISGGRIIESLAKEGQSMNMPFTVPLLGSINQRTRSCNFSFSGLQTQVMRKIADLREHQNLTDETCCDVAAGFQEALVKHMLNQIERGTIFCRRRKGLLPSSFTLVLSGGVASNSYFRDSALRWCQSKSVRLVCPPRHLCTDNGIMIAWTGMEYLKQGIGFAENIDEVDFEHKSPLGVYIGKDIIKENIILPGMVSSRRKKKRDHRT